MNLDALRERAKIVRGIRRFFDDLGFVEVETAVRIPAPAPEEHIDCPPVAEGGFLRASPELQMKKLLAAGLEKIYQIGPCFREGEKGSRHNPEFTMIEWYRKNATYLDIKDDLERLFNVLTLDAQRSTSRDGDAGRKTLDAAENLAPGATHQAPVTISVRDAYLAFAGWDPWQGVWDQNRFDFDMATKVEPAIGERGGGVFLTDYPPQAASLAKLSTRDGIAFAERWEFYLDGIELANCFTELCDSAEQRRRFEKARVARAALGEADYPPDEDFLARLDSIGSAAGVALGVDRLVMALLQVREISAVRAAV